MKNLVFFAISFLISSAAYASNKPVVLFVTSMGDIEVELNAEKAPKTVANVLQYVKQGFYSNTIFHRVIKGFMIQGGGFDTKSNLKSVHASVANVAYNGLTNKRGSIAMARTNMPHSATAQFFINTVNNKNLDFTSQSPRGWGYAVFGNVIKGMNIVDKIEQVTTGPNAFFMSDAPQTQVVILNARLIKE